MKSKPPPENMDRRVALLALKATEPSGAAEPCPSDEQLAAFIGGQLKGKERKAMLAHLNRCSRCYDDWLEAASYLLDSPAPAPQPKPLLPWPVWHRIMMWLTPWKLAVPTAALVAVVCLVILLPPSFDVNAEIDKGYAAIKAQETGRLAGIAQELPLPWENAALGFSESQPPPSTQAFGAGLWAGRATLLNRDQSESPLPPFLTPDSKSPWQDTDWADYYQLGRWTALLWALAQSDPRAPDWDRQQRILQELQAKLKKRSSKEIETAEAISALGRIEQRLAEVRQQTDSPALVDLRRELDVIIQQLGPS